MRHIPLIYEVLDVFLEVYHWQTQSFAASFSFIISLNSVTFPFL